MSDQASPSTRCARRRTSATSAASPGRRRGEQDLDRARGPHRPPDRAAGRGTTGEPPGGQSAGDRAAGGEQHRAGPAAGAQLDDGRPAGRRSAGKSVGKSRMPRTSAPAEGVDALVGVADGDEVAAAAGERLQQPHLRRIGVLVLVDDTTERRPARALAARGRPRAARRRPGPGRCGRAPRRSGSRAKRPSYCSWNAAAAHSAAGRRAPGGQRSAPTPRSVARSEQLAQLGAEAARRQRRSRGPRASGRRPPPRRAREQPRAPRGPARRR